MKRVRKLIIAFVVLLVLAFLVTYWSIDSVARRAVEKQATQALGVDTSVNLLTLGLFSGELKMHGLNVANPNGFESKHFLKLGKGEVAVSLGSLMGDRVEVPTLELSDIDLNLEKKGKEANYQVILNNLKGQDNQDPNAQPGKKFIIRTIAIRNVTIHLDMYPLPGIGGKATRLDLEPIPEIVLKDVGSDADNGVAISEVTNIIVKAVMQAVVKKAGGVLPAEITAELVGSLAQLDGLGKVGIEIVGGTTKIAGEALGEIGKQLPGDAGKAVGDIGKGVGKAGEKAKEGADKVLEGVGDLLGGKKKEEQEQK